MRLPDDDDRQPGLGIVKMVIAVCAVMAVILIAVLLANKNRFTKRRVNAVPSSEASASNEASQGELASGGTLTPDDFDFWDLYPEGEPTDDDGKLPGFNGEEESEEPVAPDPATDGKHTLIRSADGKEEWVVISPYLPKNNYDYTKLVLAGDIMQYVEDGKNTAYVGTDLSKYNDYVDFGKLRKAGLSFVMLRVGARGYGTGQIMPDEYFADNLKRATDAGLNVGLYFYSQAINEEEAIEEANLVLESIGEYAVTYPIAYDMEFVAGDTARVEALSRAERTAVAKAFLDTIKDAGYVPMLYGDKEWLIRRIDLSKLTGYDVWLSEPQDIPDYPYKFSMWRYSDTADIDGIKGYANLDLSFVDFTEK